MAKHTVRYYTPEESKKMFGGKHLIIVGGGIKRKSGKPSKALQEVNKLLQKEAAEALGEPSISVTEEDRNDPSNS